jgi:hypothetical protein
MDSHIVEELATRLPKTELAQIIKGMLECGKRNIVVGEADLIRAITFGASAVFGKVVQPQEQRVSTITQTRPIVRREGAPAVAPPEATSPAAPARRAGGG